MVNDYNKARVVFKTGAWIEARIVEIDFESREITVEDIGDTSGISEADTETLKRYDGITFQAEIEPVKIIECDAGSFTLPF